MPNVLAILSDTTVRRSAVDQEDLKPYWKSEKSPHFSRRPTILLFTNFYSKLPSWELQKYYAVSELVIEGKTGKKIPESSRLGFLEKFSGNNFALSDA